MAAPSIYWVTCCHMNEKIMESSRQALANTLEPEEQAAITKAVIVDHRYPLGDVGPYIKKWAKEFNAHLICPPVNLGGHGGITYGINFLAPQNDDDIVFIVDPDSNPLTNGWFTAAFQALMGDSSLGAVSLTDESIKDRPWTIEATPFKPRLGFLPAAEMWNMTALRYKMLRGSGLTADSRFYGWVETSMWRKMQNLKLRHGYLLDFLEARNPVPQDPEYEAWKDAHAFHHFTGNFEDYLRAHPPQSG